MKRVVMMLLVAGATAVGAQQPVMNADSAIARALKIAETDTVGARRLLDSLATSASSPAARGEATYQLAQLAASAADRERILGGLILDLPFSPRVPPALRELGMLELARNDRERAAIHLSRYLSASPPPDSGRITASLELGKLLMDRGDLPRACAALLAGQSEVPEGAIELRNQFQFSVARCQGVDTTVKSGAKPASDNARGTQRTGAFTVQVAAYDTKKAADKLATSLRGQGLEARVIGKDKPFRVRVGRYATRAEAEEASRRVDKLAKSQSIVVIVGPEER